MQPWNWASTLSILPTLTCVVAVRRPWGRLSRASGALYPGYEGRLTHWRRAQRPGASRYHLLQAFEISLRRLQTDHIDLYYAHRWDDTTPIEETLRALDDLVRLGKVCYVGASEYASWQLAHANLLAEVRGWTPFVVLQSRYNMLDRQVEREVLPYCRAHGVGFIPYHPLAGGFLTGKYKRGEPPPPGSRGARDPRACNAI